MKSTKMFSAKKKMASKFAKSKAGELTIKKNLGESGWILFSSFLDCMLVVMDKKEINDFKKRTFKFIIKIALLVDKEMINTEQLAELKPLISNLTSITMKTFNLIKQKSSENKIIDQIGRFSTKKDEFSSQLLQIIDSLMKEENKKNLETLLQEINSEKMKDLLLNPSNLHHVETMSEKLQEIAGNSHVAKLSNSIFCDKYYGAIMICRSTWKKALSKGQIELGNTIVESFTKKDEKYRGLIDSVLEIPGEEKGESICKKVSCFLSSLEHWENTSVQLKNLGDEWNSAFEKETEKNKAVEDFLESIKECALVNVNKTSTLDKKKINCIIKVIFDAICE